MKITIFGLTLSSSWGNGHATPYRAILRALGRRGIDLTFYEKDVPYYARHRDFDACDYCDLQLYAEWNDVRTRAIDKARHSDVVITASYCPEGARINDEILELPSPLRVFYDLDTPITMDGLATGPLDYLRREQIPAFDLYLSFTGGRLLRSLEQQYGARMARPLYGCVDPDIYFRVPPKNEFACWLSYLGTYAPDRQEKLDQLFIEPARRTPDQKFLLAGSLYPAGWRWPDNIYRREHVSPGEHPVLYSSSRATLNITRQKMAESGYCASGRFFEAAACGAPLFSDCWEGLDAFFDINRELRVVRTAADVLDGLAMPHPDLQAMAEQARRRTLEEHTGERRAAQLLTYCEQAAQSQISPSEVVA